jgi:hypothetical protein
MKLAATTLWIYALLMVGGGIYAFLSSRTLDSLVAASLLAVLLVLLSILSKKGHLPAGYLGGIVVFLLAIFFAYRFLATERFFPSGVLLILSFFALFGVTLGVFLGLQDTSERGD